MRLITILLLLSAAACRTGAPPADPPADVAEPAAPPQWLTLRPGQSVIVEGTVTESGPAPEPGDTPYRDHVLMLRVDDLRVDGTAHDGAALVYVRSMRDNTITAEGRLRPGDAVRLRLRPWSEVARFYQAIQRGDIEELWDQPMAWGELAD